MMVSENKSVYIYRYVVDLCSHKSAVSSLSLISMSLAYESLNRHASVNNQRYINTYEEAHLSRHIRHILKTHVVSRIDDKQKQQ